MRIGLVDVDGRNFPNLVLMKLSAWHKFRGDTVEFADPVAGRYDKVYLSKVFTHTPDCRDEYRCEVIRGGTGYRDYTTTLPEAVEHTCPDYSLYGVGEAYGFLTRGCPNRCSWCVVPRKEGAIRPHADIEEFLAGRKRAVLLDNNVLASAWGLAQIEKIVRLGVRVDFNQGLDVRRIARNPELAELLARVRWLRFLRMAYDSCAVQEDVHNAVELLVKCGLSPRKLFFYVLVRDDIGDALERIRELKALGCVPFAQPYRDFTGGTKPVPKRIGVGETAEIRCTLVREGEYADARYTIRYFQPDGKGELRMDDGTVFLPNDRYPLERFSFRLYYTSRSDDQQTIDVYIEDNMGQVVQKSFTFQNDSDTGGEEQ